MQGVTSDYRLRHRLVTPGLEEPAFNRHLSTRVHLQELKRSRTSWQRHAQIWMLGNCFKWNRRSIAGSEVNTYL